MAMDARGRTGMEIMQGIASGAVPPPPVARLLGMKCVAVEDGAVRFTAKAAIALTNPQGTIHGGIIATLLDTAMTCAIFTKLPRGKSCTTTDLNVQFVRPVAPDDGVMTAEGTVVNAGTTRATARAELTNAAGKLCAYATGGAAIIEMPASGTRDRHSIEVRLPEPGTSGSSEPAFPCGCRATRDGDAAWSIAPCRVHAADA